MLRTCIAVLGLAALMLAGCVPVKRLMTKQVGREGWELHGAEENHEINAVRGMNQSVWITHIKNDPNRFVVKITPKEQPLETPPWAHHLNSETCALWYECRTYAVPAGKTFNDVYAWYMAWFDFKYKG